MKIMIMNGPNLNLLGVREPDIYGKETYASLLEKITSHAILRGLDVQFVQSNHEGELVDAIHKAFYDGLDGIVMNPGAYTHTSIALLDALKATKLPAVEIHISDPDTREPFRRVSYVRAACIATVAGHGINGYLEAIDILIDHLNKQGAQA